MLSRACSLAILYVLAGTDAATTISGGIALTPPMGWNPYNHYGCGGSDARVRKQTNALLALGLDKAGFVFINIDCGWAQKVCCCATRSPRYTHARSLAYVGFLLLKSNNQ